MAHRRWARVVGLYDRYCIANTEIDEPVLVMKHSLNEEPIIGDMISFEPADVIPNKTRKHPVKFFGQNPVIIARLLRYARPLASDRRMQA